MTTDGRPIEAIATGQHGNFTRQQASAAGLTRGVLRSRDQSGNLVKVGVRTFASPLTPRSALTDLSALMLDVGDPVWTCGPTAAALNGCDGFVLAPPFHLLTLSNRNVRRLGHVIHTTNDLPLIDQVIVNGFRATSATRTIIDLARSMPAASVTAAIDSALRDGLTSETFLHRRISELRSRGRYGIPALLAIIEGAEITRGGHSWLERRFLEIVGGAGLPRPSTQAVLARAGDKLVRDTRTAWPRAIRSATSAHPGRQTASSFQSL